MADEHTPYWHLVEPEVGSSRDTWGTKWNQNLLDIDTLLQALMPVGALLDFSGAAAPTGWLLCDGTIYTTAAFPRLFAAIGNRYGGDGVTNFAVPDLRARATMGVGSTVGDQGTTLSLTLGQRSGDWLINIGQVNLPNYAITTTFAGSHNHPGSVSDITGNHAHTAGTDVQGDHGHSTSLPNLGTGAAGGPFSVFSDVFGFGSYASSVNGAHAHNVNVLPAGLHQHGLAISSDGNHQHTFNLGGSGAALRILPPMFAATKIICCGPPSMQTLAGGDSPPALLMAPMRGMH